MLHREALIKTANDLVQKGKGLLAMDESMPTCHKRFAALGIPETEEARRSYRELIVTTPKLGDFISGAILFDETVYQSTKAGVSFIEILNNAGIIPGIKVDGGTKDLALCPNEKITEGLDGLRERLETYSKLGLRFAKWRAVIVINEKGLPTKAAIKANAHALCRYAALCQEVGLVPIVEPEVLMDGNHSLERCFEVTQKVLHTVFHQLFSSHILLEGMILKPNMVLPGLSASKQETVTEVANSTIRCLLRTVPAAVPGIAFLSGGQPAELATERLNEMNVKFKSQLPWRVTFSFSRALQDSALKIWKGQESNVKKAQEMLYHRAKCNGAASQGLYTKEMEIA